ncbi:hypothetical protein B296_00004392 [Ensete ventricosum]|uniref:CBF1-interacting co-repressor CIR N-terminal domain-containing protein n=1 Tax=Ensete ventricosum TaxID=4639 RepID=A0A427ATP8_ENSVE|nr:hypothetical protein B296_00004392 [Ensete ventricosum]
MALKFLNKKGWHTGSLRNIENVWKAEQKHEAEQRKLEELRKQIQDEREKSEFRLLQEQAGLVPLDFLYESGLAVGKGSSDGFKALQAPPAVASTTSTSEASSSKKKTGYPPTLAHSSTYEFDSLRSTLFEDKPQSANDAWRKLHSDPLLLIRQREQEALARIKNNPIKMAMIKKSVEDEKKKQDKKEKKRHKDHHHSRSKHDKRSEYTSDNQEDKTRERQTSVQQEGRSKRHKHSSRYLSDSEDAKEGAEEKRKSDCLTYEHYQRRSSKHDKHSLKDSSRRAGEGEEEGKNLQTILERQQHIHSKNEKPSSRGHSYSRYTHEENGTRSNFSASEHHTDSELGMEDKNRETNRQREQPGYNRRRGAPKMSEEERAARLREMQLDAELHEEQRLKRLKRATEADAQEAMRASFSRGKNFLDAAQKSIYGAEKGGSATIEESVRRRAYYSQGSSAAHESNAFRRNNSVGFEARGRCEASTGLGGVLAVRGLFPCFVVGYLQEKISVGGGLPNEAALELFLISIGVICMPAQGCTAGKHGKPLGKQKVCLEMLGTESPWARLTDHLEILGTESPWARLRARLEMLG